MGMVLGELLLRYHSIQCSAPSSLKGHPVSNTPNKLKWLTKKTKDHKTTKNQKNKKNKKNQKNQKNQKNKKNKKTKKKPKKIRFFSMFF
jgi:hypothetical protein